MSIRYRILPLKNPRDLMAPEKYYLIEKSIGSIGRNYLVKDMVRHTSLTKQEAETGIDYLFDAIPRFLELGFTVQLGRIGYFMTTIKSEGSDTEKEATVDKVRRIRLNFVPGEDIRTEVNNYSLEKFPETT